MKIILHFLLAIFLFGHTFEYSYALVENINTGLKNQSNGINNDHLTKIKTENDFNATVGGEKGLYYTLVRVAKDLKNGFFFIASMYFLILVAKLIFSSKTEDEVGNFKKGILWISIGLIVMQISYTFALLLYDKGIGQGVAFNAIDRIVYPLLSLLETAVSFFFIGIAIYAFFRMVSANGDDAKATEGKKSIMYALIGFAVIKFAKELVASVYGTIDCNTNVGGLFQIVGNNCIEKGNLLGFTAIVVEVINWANSIIGIIVILLIIYSGVKVIFSGGDDEKLKHAKKNLIYIGIGLFLLFANYLILTFFIIPEKVI